MNQAMQFKHPKKLHTSLFIFGFCCYPLLTPWKIKKKNPKKIRKKRERKGKKKGKKEEKAITYSQQAWRRYNLVTTQE